MPKLAEFEEKEYERPLYSELARDSPVVWAPGQVLEHHLGFDAALDVATHPVWAVLGLARPLPGVLLRDASNVGLSAITGVRPGRMPDFRVNLFVQAKRPVVLKRRTKGLKQYPISSPYWRFDLDPTQQSTLERIERAQGTEAAVVYASPAFDSMDELTKHTLAGAVVAESSFVSCRSVAGHDSWAYDEPGGVGYGCSDPELIEGPALSARLERLSSLATLHEIRSPVLVRETLEALRVGLMSSLETVSPVETRISAFLRTSALLAELSAPDLPVEQMSFLEVSLLTHFLNLEWFVIG